MQSHTTNNMYIILTYAGTAISAIYIFVSPLVGGSIVPPHTLYCIKNLLHNCEPNTVALAKNRLKPAAKQRPGERYSDTKYVNHAYAVCIQI